MQIDPDVLERVRQIDLLSYLREFEPSNLVKVKGPVKIYAQNCLQAPTDLKSAGNRGVVHDRLQVLHVHVFLVAPLGARHMAEPGADQHQGGVAVRECPHHAGPAADLPVQPLDHVVGTDAGPVFAGKIAVGQCLLHAILDFLGSLLQLHRSQLVDHGLCLLAGCLFALLRVDRLEHFCHNFDLGFGHNRENVAVEMHRAALVFGIREHLAHGLQHPHALVADDELHAIQAASAEPPEEAAPAGLVLFHAFDTPNLVISTVSVTTSFLTVSLTMLRSSYYAIRYAANNLVLIVM